MEVNKVVPYYQFNYILANCEGKVFPIPSGLCFNFKEYVYSQVHFPLVTRLKSSRNIRDYLLVQNVLDGNEDLTEDNLKVFIKVLQFFYEDIGHSLESEANSDSDFTFSLHVCDMGVLSVREISGPNVVDELLQESRSEIPVALEVN